MSYEFHTEILRNIAIQMQPNIYVELGICGAYTFNAILPHVQQEAYGCDIGNFISIVTPEYKHKVKNYGLTRTDGLAYEWTEKIKKPIDLIFIDADHSKESVMKDIENFWPFLKEDTGLMLLHDMWPPAPRYTDKGYCGDGYLIKKKLDSIPNMEFVTLPLQYGVGIIRKRGKAWQNGRLDS